VRRGAGRAAAGIDWESCLSLCKQLQPNAVTFGDGGTDVRWIGNERGFAGDPNWCTVTSTLVRFPGDAGIDQATDARARKLAVLHQLQHGEESGDVWRPGECDVSIRPGWFYHAAENEQIRSVENLVDLYFKSVGRNAGLLLNVPPTPDGLLHRIDVARLRGMRVALDRMFRHDLTADAEVVSAGKGVRLLFPSVRQFDILRLAEAVEFGQRIQHYRIHYRDPAGHWAWLLDGDTVGVMKLDRFVPVSATALQIDIVRSRVAAALSEVGAFRSGGVNLQETP
jgi:alpha-L-fucosidase